MGSSTIFAGSKVKALKSILNLNGGAEIISSTTDPTSSAVSAEPGSILLNTSSGKLYRKNDSGSSTNWTEVGSSAAFGINYITNPLAATNTTGWATYADAAGAQPVDGTGGTANVTWTRSTTTPLRGAADFNFVKDAANRQGEGVSTDFTIDLADLAKVLTVTFDYEVVSGTYADGDLTVYLIADPAGTPVIIQPAGYTVLNAVAGTKMKQIATFQTQATGQSYRLCFHVASTSASAYTLALDNISVGPQVVQYGAPMTDWVAFTPTSSNITTSTITGRRRRVGDSLEIQYYAKLSAQPSGTVTLDMPTGFSIDTAKLARSSYRAIGYAKFYDDSAANTYVGIVVQDISNNKFTVAGQGTGLWSGTVPVTGANNDEIEINVVVPITGWSSTVQMSNDTDTRVVAMRASKNSGSHTSSGNFQDIASWDTTEFDTHASFTASTGIYTVPVAGYYEVSGAVGFAANATGTRGAAVLVGSTVQFYSAFATASSAAGTGVTYSGIVSVKAGDTIKIQAFQSSTANLNYDTSAKITSLSIKRISGPATIAASETVAARYTTAAGQSIPNTATYTTVDFATKDYDTHGAVTTGASWKFTAPVSGKYRVNVMSAYDSLAWTAGNSCYSRIYKNATTSYSIDDPAIWASVTDIVVLKGSVTLDLVAGDYLTYQMANGRTGGNSAMFANASYNYIEVQRVGN